MQHVLMKTHRIPAKLRKIQPLAKVMKIRIMHLLMRARTTKTIVMNLARKRAGLAVIVHVAMSNLVQRRTKKPQATAHPKTSQMPMLSATPIAAIRVITMQLVNLRTIAEVIALMIVSAVVVTTTDETIVMTPVMATAATATAATATRTAIAAIIVGAVAITIRMMKTVVVDVVDVATAVTVGAMTVMVAKAAMICRFAKEMSCRPLAVSRSEGRRVGK